MTEEELKKLYAQLLELSQNIPRSGRLEAPQASVTMVSPLCGSQIGVDLSLHEGRVSEFAQKVRACTLGAAAASIVGAAVLGHTPHELRALRERMHAMLKHGNAPPDGDWATLALLEPAQDLVSRHGSVMLIFDALCAALDDIEGTTKGAAVSDDGKGIPDTIRA
jgi:NifU-like protein involved in Fe-S cluster formation